MAVVTALEGQEGKRKKVCKVNERDLDLPWLVYGYSTEYFFK